MVVFFPFLISIQQFNDLPVIEGALIRYQTDSYQHNGMRGIRLGFVTHFCLLPHH